MTQYEEYRLLALEKIRLAELALNSDEDLGGSILEYCHFALELTRFVLQLWLKIYCTWDTSKRYSYEEYDQDDIDELFHAYKRVLVWIESNYVN